MIDLTKITSGNIRTEVIKKTTNSDWKLYIVRISIIDR